MVTVKLHIPTLTLRPYPYLLVVRIFVGVDYDALKPKQENNASNLHSKCLLSR